jgi:hypothetical protein
MTPAAVVVAPPVVATLQRPPQRVQVHLAVHLPMLMWMVGFHPHWLPTQTPVHLTTSISILFRDTTASAVTVAEALGMQHPRRVNWLALLVRAIRAAILRLTCPTSRDHITPICCRSCTLWTTLPATETSPTGKVVSRCAAQNVGG